MPKNYSATYCKKDQVATHSYDGDLDQAKAAFQNHMEEINPEWARLISMKTGKLVDEYEKKHFVGIFEGKAMPVKGSKGPYLAVWTDGVSVEQQGKRTSLEADNESFAAFRLIEGEHYRVTVKRIEKP